MTDDDRPDPNQENLITELGISTAADLLAFLRERPQFRVVIVGSYHPDDAELFAPAVTDSGEVLAWINPLGSAAAMLRSVADHRPTDEAIRAGLQFLPAFAAWVLPDHPRAITAPRSKVH